MILLFIYSNMKKIIALIVIAITLLFIIYISIYITLYPSIKAYGKNEMSRFNQLIVTHSYLTDQSIYSDVVHIGRNSEGNVDYIDFDMIKLNSITNETILNIEETYYMIEHNQYIKKNNSYYEERLQEVSQKGIVAKIPITTLLHMPFLNIISPKISLKFNHLSQVSGSIIRKYRRFEF